jgi:xanthine dehydrogenase accessory factor
MKQSAPRELCRMPENFYQQLVAACQEPNRFVLGIIAGAKGSTPQKRGAKALFLDNGRIIGTLGGGCLEAEVRKRGFETLRTGEPQNFELVLDHDFGWDDGLICGGKVSCILLPTARDGIDVWRSLAARDRTLSWEIRPDYSVGFVQDCSNRNYLYRETVNPPEHLWIAGAGHIARAVAPLAQQLDFQVTVFDDRAELANRDFFASPVQLRVDHWEKLLEEQLPNSPTLGLIVTRGHQHDAMALSKWIKKRFVFLGMIGSKRKKRIIFSHFIDEGIATQDQLDAVACPVGLPIGGISVDEIAISIVAQLVQNRSERRISREAAIVISPKPSLTSPRR